MDTRRIPYLALALASLAAPLTASAYDPSDPPRARVQAQVQTPRPAVETRASVGAAGAGVDTRAGVGVQPQRVEVGTRAGTTSDGRTVAEVPEVQPLTETARVSDTVEVPLQSGCTYVSTVTGTVRPVRERRSEPSSVQRLRPDLRVGATVRCPGSTESHIQERAVRSTGVTREELERLIELNASVDRMQNTGRCMYVPDVAFDNVRVITRDVQYLCPAERGGARGGGPSND